MNASDEKWLRRVLADVEESVMVEAIITAEWRIAIQAALAALAVGSAEPMSADEVAERLTAAILATPEDERATREYLHQIRAYFVLAQREVWRGDDRLVALLRLHEDRNAKPCDTFAPVAGVAQ